MHLQIMISCEAGHECAASTFGWQGPGQSRSHPRCAGLDGAPQRVFVSRLAPRGCDLDWPGHCLVKLEADHSCQAWLGGLQKAGSFWICPGCAVFPISQFLTLCVVLCCIKGTRSTLSTPTSSAVPSGAYTPQRTPPQNAIPQHTGAWHSLLLSVRWRLSRLAAAQRRCTCRSTSTSPTSCCSLMFTRHLDHPQRACQQLQTRQPRA